MAVSGKISIDKNDKDNIEEVIIIGSGPAGLTAGIYTSRADLEPLILAGAQYGGQLMFTTEVENFPGFPEGIMGPELIQNMVTQAEKFGARLVYKNVTKVNLSEKPFEKPHEVWVDDELYQARAVILATGARPRKLGVPGEERLWGKGVSSCATCDGAFYKEKIVAVIGGGDSAMEEADFLTRFAKKVYVIHRRNELRASQIMQERAKRNERIEFVYNTVVSEILGDEKVEGVKVKNNETEIESEIKIDGFFLAIGYIPETELFKDFVTVDNKGYAEPQTRTMSEIPGVFIAGDVEDAVYRQAITAAADGCKAALDAERWLMEA